MEFAFYKTYPGDDYTLPPSATLAYDEAGFQEFYDFLVTAALRLERRNSRNVFADNQGVDVVGAFVGLYGLQVGHVPEDGVLIRNAVAA